jgi:hypothetical protein
MVARLMYEVKIERGKLRCDARYKFKIEQGRMSLDVMQHEVQGRDRTR